MKRILALSLLSAAVLLPAGSSLAANEKQMAAKKMPAAANEWGEMPAPHYMATRMPVSATRGQVVFIDHCAICHGLQGKGDGPRSAFFVHGQQYIADLSSADFVNGRDDQLLNSIREGLRRFPEPSYVMPQFKYILSDEEIRSALAYIKTLPKQAKQ
jgi:cytochrome c553